MKNLFFLLAATSLFLLGGCKKDETKPQPQTKEVTVFLKATWDGQPLEQAKDYVWEGTKVFDIQRFTLYLSDIELTKAGANTRLSEIEFFDFFSDPSSTLAQTKSFKTKILADKYDGLKIGFGVKPDLNAKQPKDFAAGHPLANEIEYWLGWKSYIFSKIEINADLDNSPAVKETFLSYHAGSATKRDVYRTGQQSVSVDLSDKSEFTLEIDLKKLFTLNGKMLDITVPDNQVTGGTPSDLGMAEILMENFINAVVVK